jgi:diacylglycerol kinase (ATP)
VKTILKFLRGRLASFRPAISGWIYVLRTQPNAWIHGLISIGVFIIALWVQLDSRDWVLLLLTVALVWLAEFFNTAVEVVVDLASPRQHKLAKHGKDIGAGAVLIAAALAVLVGILLLGPPLVVRVLSLGR